MGRIRSEKEKADHNLWMRQDRLRNPEKHKKRDRLRYQREAERRCAYQKVYRRNNFKRCLLATAKRSARIKGLEFNITADDIQFYILCPYLRIPLVYDGATGRTDNSASLDRIDSTKGYISGNVEIISWRANRIKNDATPKEIELIARRLNAKA